MKIATWNINGVRARIDTLLAWLKESGPDIVCLQEIKCQDESFPRAEIEAAGYHVETHGFGGFEDCALRVQARVVSHAAQDRCVIDAGSKSLTSDLLGLTGHGRILEHLDWEIYGLSEEHGHVRVPPGAERPRIGEIVTVVPNHACVVTNLYDRIYAVRQGRVETFYEVAARGKVF